jgi:superfamily II DNA or RNA helicase
VTCSLTPSVSPPLWPHQCEALDLTFRAIGEGKGRALWVMPTGTGKTRAFAVLAARLSLPTLVLVHRDELLHQAAAAIREDWPSVAVGTLPGNGWQDAPVVVATVQSLAHRLSAFRPDRFGLIVVDEAHHATARSWLKVLQHFGPQLLLGCTATPRRLDGQSLSGLFGPPLYEYGLKEAIAAGYLVPVRQRAVLTGISLASVRVRSGDFIAKDLAAAVIAEGRSSEVVRAYQEHGAGRPMLVFAVDLAHVEQLHRAFADAGLAVASITGRMPREQRRRVLTDFREGRLQGLVSCEVLTEGYDERRVSCIVMARPTLSPVLYRQCVGRGLRADPDGGKADCLVLDVLDLPAGQRVLTAATLFGGHVEDCEGKDVREAVRQEKGRLQVAPLRPSLRLLRRWEEGEETRWEEQPDLSGYRPTRNWENAPATAKQVRRLTREGFEMLRPLTTGEAAHLIRRCEDLDEKYPTPATPEQRGLLCRLKLWEAGLTKRRAQRRIGSYMVGG